MEVVGAAASVAGILGLTGQVLSGLLTVSKFLRDVQQAPKRIEELLGTIGSMRDTLEEVKHFLEEASQWPRDDQSRLATLRNHLGRCKLDIDEWAQIARNTNPNSWNGLKSFLRRAKIAANLSASDDIEKKIFAHQQRIHMSLSILGRSMDVLSGVKVDNLSSQMKSLTDAHLAAQNKTERDQESFLNGKMQEKLLDMMSPVQQSLKRGFDEYKAGQEELAQSIRRLSASVSSIASNFGVESPRSPTWGSPLWSEPRDHRPSLYPKLDRTSTDIYSDELYNPNFTIPYISPPSKIQSNTDTVDQKSGPVTSTWSCSAISGIDDLWTNNGTCLYCGVKYQASNSVARGKHLIEAHNYGNCSGDFVFTSANDLFGHLQGTHSAACRSLDLLNSHISIPQRQGLSKLVALREGRLTTDQDFFDAIPTERTASRSLLELRLADILREAASLDFDEISSEIVPTMQILERLKDLYMRVFQEEPNHRNVQKLGLRCAILEEEHILLDVELGTAFEGPGEEPCLDEITGWRSKYGLESQNIPLEAETEALSATKGCSLCDDGIWFTRIDACRHLEVMHAIDGAKKGLCYSVTFRPQDLWKQLFQTATDTHSRTEAWLLGCFVESWTTRVILRFSEATKHFYLSASAHWASEFLKYWSWGLDNSCFSSIASHGAVDSRDNLSTLLSGVRILDDDDGLPAAKRQRVQD